MNVQKLEDIFDTYMDVLPNVFFGGRLTEIVVKIELHMKDIPEM